MYGSKAQLSFTYSASGQFADAFTPRADSIIEALCFYVHGTYTTDSAANDDGEMQIIADLDVRVPRRGLPSIFSRANTRDLKSITNIFSGALIPRAVPATAGAFYGYFEVPFVPFDAKHPHEWGIDAQEIKDQIQISGSFGAVTTLGASVTAITASTRVSVRSRRRKSGKVGDLMALCYNPSFFSTESASDFSEKDVPFGEVDAAYGIHLRTHDASAVTASAVNTLVNKLTISHSEEGYIHDKDYWLMARNQWLRRNPYDAAGVKAGTMLIRTTSRGYLSDMADMRGQVFRSAYDLSGTFPDEVTKVTPASGDGVHQVGIGASYNSSLRARLKV